MNKNHVIIRQHANGEIKAFGPITLELAKDRLQVIAYPTPAHDIVGTGLRVADEQHLPDCFVDNADPDLSYTIIPLEATTGETS